MSLRVAVVTGGASGLGRIFALRMAAQGIQVAVVDRNSEALSSVAWESSRIHAVRCDVSSSAELSAAFAEIESELGTIDRLVTCAAIMPTSKLAEQDTREIRGVMAVNYGGTVNAVQAVLPAMAQRGAGELIIFGSTGGSVLVPDCGAYCASKAATNLYAEMLIEEMRGSGVRVMLVCPALVDTPLLQQAVATSNPKVIADSIAKNRFTDPEFIIDEVEKAFRKRTEILMPGAEAKAVMWLRRMSPGLLWRIVRMANRD
jgi:NAD(P)-dependent dehydrogenase (short-subunit alcohol dehydrogenase family)